jgi:hypothetical protein
MNPRTLEAASEREAAGKMETKETAMGKKQGKGKNSTAVCH